MFKQFINGFAFCAGGLLGVSCLTTVAEMTLDVLKKTYPEVCEDLLKK